MSRSVSRSGNTPLPPRPAPITVNTQTKVFNSAAGRILCIADVRGRIATINELVEETKADAVIHTGDFGFFGMSFFSFSLLAALCFSIIAFDD